MADPNKEQDEFAEINKKVQDQAAEIFNISYGKYITALSLCTSGDENFSIFAVDNGHIFLNTHNGNIGVFEDNCRLLIKSFDLFDHFYNKIIKQSKTWQKLPLMSEQVTRDITFNDVKFSDFEKLEFENENIKSAIKNVCESISGLINILTSNGSQKTVTKESITMSKFLEIEKSLKSNAKRCADVLKDAWKNGLGPKSEDNEISNYSDIEDDLKKISCVIVGNKKEEKTEELPPEVEKAVDTVAKEVITVNDKPEDPNVAEKFKKIESDMQKTKEIVMKWADPKKNKSMNHKLMNVIHTIGQDVASQLIPQAWIFAAMNRVKDVIGEAIAQKTLLNLLNEVEEQGSGQAQSSGESADSSSNSTAETAPKDGEDENEKKETVEKVKKLVDAVDEILQKQKPTEFKDAYRNWLKEVQEVMKAASENEKIKEKLEKALGGDSDPYKQICLLYLALTSKDENEEEGEGDGSKEEPAKPAAGAENSSFAWNFQNYIKESLNK